MRLDCNQKSDKKGLVNAGSLMQVQFYLEKW